MDKPERRLAAAAVAALLFGLCFVGSFLAAFHQPTPHGVNVGIVGPPQVVQQVQGGLEKAMPGGFDVLTYPDETAARAAIVNRDVEGALVLSPQGGKELIASAAGIFPSNLVKEAFAGVAQATGQHFQVTDVAPLPSSDRAGIKDFFIVISTVLPSLALGIGSTLVAGAVAARKRAAALVGFSVVLAAGVVWVADMLTGSLGGSYWALTGIAALFALAVSSTAAGLVRIHPAGAALAMFTFIIFGIPPTGGPARFFVPSFYHIFDPWLPTPAAVTTLRNTSYFHAHDIALPLTMLVVWAVGGLLLVLATGRMRPSHGAVYGAEQGAHAPAGRMAAKEA